jgi:hypothetical protein
MGKVLLGAILGAGIGLFLGWIPTYPYDWEIIQPGSRFSLPLARLLHPLSMMIGAGAGGVIGAIAGRVAADPNSTPLPRWVSVSVLVILVSVLLLGVIGVAMQLFRSSPPHPPAPEHHAAPGPLEMQGPPPLNPPGAEKPMPPGGPR